MVGWGYNIVYYISLLFWLFLKVLFRFVVFIRALSLAKYVKMSPWLPCVCMPRPTLDTQTSQTLERETLSREIGILMSAVLLLFLYYFNRLDCATLKSWGRGGDREPKTWPTCTYDPPSLLRPFPSKSNTDFGFDFHLIFFVCLYVDFVFLWRRAPSLYAWVYYVIMRAHTHMYARAHVHTHTHTHTRIGLKLKTLHTLLHIYRLYRKWVLLITHIVISA